MKIIFLFLSIILISSFTPLSYSEDLGDIFDDLDENPESIDYFVEKGFKIYVLEDPYGEYYIPYKTNGTLNSVIYLGNSGSTLVLNTTSPNTSFYIILPSFLLGFSPEIDNVYADIYVENESLFIHEPNVSGKYFINLNIDKHVFDVEVSTARLPTYINADPFLPYYKKTIDTIYFDVYPPKKQIQNNILIKEILCDHNLQLIKKQHDTSPACVSQNTKDVLLERGWINVR